MGKFNFMDTVLIHLRSSDRLRENTVTKPKIPLPGQELILDTATRIPFDGLMGLQ